MKFYVIGCKNILSPLYFLYIINMSHHFFIIDFKQTNYAKKKFKLKFQFFSQLYFIKLCIHTATFFLNENVFKSHKHSLMYTNK